MAESSVIVGDAVKVAVRVRPPYADPANIDEDGGCVQIHEENIIMINGQPFQFNRVLSEKNSQAQIYEEVIVPLVGKLQKGFNCTALAYGQTGTGKSYTMGISLESLDVTKPDRLGIVPRCIQDILTMSSPETELHISFVEVYNEKAFDLLGEDPSAVILTRGAKYNGGERKRLVSVEQFRRILEYGTKNRHVRSTTMNSQSSRSHAILTLHYKAKKDVELIESCFNFVDLAGSEGVRRTGHQGAAMFEGVNINQGLLCISKILLAMSEGQKMIPYRDSILGTVLQDSLSPYSYLTLLACVSPDTIDLSETLSTVRFAQRAKQLKRTPLMTALLSEMAKNKPKTQHRVLNRSSKKTPASSQRSILTSRNMNIISDTERRYNTFCTPDKEKTFVANKLNNTDMPNVNQRNQYGMDSQRLMYQNMNGSCFRESNGGRVFNRDSLFDGTNESIFSNMNFNVSTSTTLGAAASQINKPFSLTPIVRKCVSEVGTVVENKLEKLFGEMCGTPGTTNGTVMQNMTGTMRSQLKDIMREILTEKKDETLVSEENVEKPTTSKRQLFVTSSPVFKHPADLPQTINNLIDTSATTVTSISMLSLNECIDPADDEQREIVNNAPRRRSVRLASTQNNYTQRRGNKRLSLKQMHDKRRKSIRLAAQASASKNQTDEAPTNRNIKKKPAPAATAAAAAPLENSVLSSYFNETEDQRSRSLKKHRKAILELLNSGSIKQLQLLPQIGQKTAYQIVTQRVLFGKFKSIAAIGKLPIWRGNSFERFAQANLLI